MAPKEKISLPFRWQFTPVTNPRDKAMRWFWRAYTQSGELALESEASFESLTECMANARSHGFGDTQ